MDLVILESFSNLNEYESYQTANECMERVCTPVMDLKKAEKMHIFQSSHTVLPNEKIADLPLNSRFWSGMYNRFEKGLHPRQSVTDYLMAVKEETQQLEEELEVLGEVINARLRCPRLELMANETQYVTESPTLYIPFCHKDVQPWSLFSHKSWELLCF